MITTQFEINNIFMANSIENCGLSRSYYHYSILWCVGNCMPISCEISRENQRYFEYASLSLHNYLTMLYINGNINLVI
jgi:hypothetical protein